MKLKLIYLFVIFTVFSGTGIFSQTGVIGSDVPKNPNILYNCPNPFYEVTTISFFLKQDCIAKLSAVDRSTGNVIELVNGVLSAGEHGIIFKAPITGSSGYKCILTAFSESDNSLLYSAEIEMEHKAK